jgi:hypothetical protein
MHPPMRTLDARRIVCGGFVRIGLFAFRRFVGFFFRALHCFLRRRRAQGTALRGVPPRRQ